MRQVNATIRPAAAVVGWVAALALAGCSSGSSTAPPASGQSRSSDSTASTPNVPPYNGPDSTLFAEIKAPTLKPGVAFRVGFLQANGAVGNLRAMQQAAQQQVSKLGGSMIALDAQLSAQTQISQFQQLIAQRVGAVLVIPLDPNALEASFKQARAAGIPVIAYNAPADTSQPTNPLITTSVNVGFDYAAYALMKDIATKRPGSTFAILGIGLPVPNLQYINARAKYWGIKLGLDFVQEADAQTDDTNGYGPAVNAIFTKNLHVDNVIAFNDESAVFAATQAQQRGITPNISCLNGGEDIARQGIVAGRMYSDYFIRWSDEGTTMANAAYLDVSKQGTPPKSVVLKSTLVTKANVDQPRPWTK